MRYLISFIIVGLWSVVAITCAQTQNDAAQHGVTEAENPKAPVNSKAIESYWTKEQMDNAKPMPTPTVVMIRTRRKLPNLLSNRTKKVRPAVNQEVNN